MMEYGDDWQREFTKFLCRCAREAHHKGYTMFGVHDHGKNNTVEILRGQCAFLSEVVNESHVSLKITSILLLILELEVTKLKLKR